jgi:hypothetical protein
MVQPLLLLWLRRRLRARTVKWVGMFVWSLPASLLPFVKAGGFFNNLMPMIVLAGPATLFLVGDVLHTWRRRPHHNRALAFAMGACVFFSAGQFIARKPIDAPRFAINANQRRAAIALNEAIAKLDGDVLIPSHPFLAVRNGKTNVQIHEMGYQDTAVAQMPGLDLPSFLVKTKPRWVVLSGSEAPYTVGWLYRLYDRVGGLDMYVSTLTGFYSSPRVLMQVRQPIERREPRVVFDFEAGDADWTREGNAFSGARGTPGSRYLTSFDDRLAEAAEGTALSPPFVVDRDLLELWIGGGMSRHTRVELVVDGATVRVASGVNSDILTPVLWQVDELRSREARIHVIDASTGYFGHITVGAVTLFDRGN